MQAKKPLKILYPAFILSFILLLTLSAHALDVPKLQGYVNDYAGMISPSVKTKLEAELKTFEQTDSTQIVILTIPSLEGDVIDSFSIKVADKWKIGQKGKDNGVIIIAAKNNRKMRIEVGRGLESTLTDLATGRIIDRVIGPSFKKGDFDGGFTAGVAALIAAAKGEFKSEKKFSPKKQENLSRFLTFLIFSGIFMLIMGSISRILGSAAGAISLPLLAKLTIAGSSGVFTLIILGLAGVVIGGLLPILFSNSSRHYGSRGPWSSGGFGGVDIGGGGGFDGGGGDFGGGGASGDW
ncbi:MAG: TPM domain-containing protein [Nitrospiraceae bacterium]|nr:TPM domain-containing protein [Nitrospiraceae bacterium]